MFCLSGTLSSPEENGNRVILGSAGTTICRGTKGETSANKDNHRQEAISHVRAPGRRYVAHHNVAHHDVAHDNQESRERREQSKTDL